MYKYNLWFFNITTKTKLIYIDDKSIIGHRDMSTNFAEQGRKLNLGGWIYWIIICDRSSEEYSF